MVQKEGEPRADRVCAVCPVGTFSASENVVQCSTWSECAAGTFVSRSPSSSVDRQCSPCLEGMSTAANQVACQLPGACPPGTVAASGQCNACEPGTVCAGGDAPRVACEAGTWDHDHNAATGCVPWTRCLPGQRVESFGSAIADRTCVACAQGLFSSQENAPACSAWSVCGAGFAELSSGTATRDRVCVEFPRALQFGSVDADDATAVAIDASDNVLMSGYVGGALAGQTSAGLGDAFVRKFDASGNVVWTHQFGTSAGDYAHGLAVDGSGNVLVVGYTGGSLPGQSITSAGGDDAFVRKYNSDGVEVWTRQFGTGSGDIASSVAADAAGQVWVAGTTAGSFVTPEPANSDFNHAFVRKYTASGDALWTQQFEIPRVGRLNVLSVDVAGNLLLAGTTGEQGFVRKLNASGESLWTRDVDLGGHTSVRAVVADNRGQVFVVSVSSDYYPAAYQGDTVVQLLTADGAEVWTQHFEGSLAFGASLVSGIGGDGVIFVGYEGGDVFARKLDASGSTLWSRRYGGMPVDLGRDVAVNRQGAPVIVGQTAAVLPGQQSTGSWDVFTMWLDP